MSDNRIREHPILPVAERPDVPFTWEGRPLVAKAGEMIASALFANGVRIFGHHTKDGAPQGIFCANGQCAQCMVIADGKPVKSCITPVQPGMAVEPADDRPPLPDVTGVPPLRTIETLAVDCLIIGGGPAGLSAALELGQVGVKTLIVDDKERLGGKLVLQTHKFFGSIEACYAGTRGIDIATRLETEVRRMASVEVWLNSVALSVFSDHKVGVLRDNHRYVLVQPKVLLVAAGAREKSLVFRGNTLPGVYGAGAFQTLVNRDLIRSAGRIFVVGGGNVGLIAAYHALQAGIGVAGLCEALPECGGYKVHRDKLARMGVPIYTSHTILSANGVDEVESVTIARIDEQWQPIPSTEKSFSCDTVLIAVGLEPVNEFTEKAKAFGLPVFTAGDAEEIAEASAAMFTGRMRGRQVAEFLGCAVAPVPPEWETTAEILKSRPGATVAEELPEREEGVFPVLHCVQEIPCNPCVSVCPQGDIVIKSTDLRALPEYVGWEIGKTCTGCEQCVAICPGLAITTVDYRKNAQQPLVTIAHEYGRESIQVGDRVAVVDMEGNPLGEVEVAQVRAPKSADRRLLVRVRAPAEIARQIAGIVVQREKEIVEPLEFPVERLADDEILCRCERVTVGELRALIRAGVHDMNALKAQTRAGMGACGGKTCTPLIRRLFREEGVPVSEITPNVVRPLFVEVPLGIFAGTESEQGEAPWTQCELSTEGAESHSL